ncbi:NUDIX hydrolase [Streptomyces tateyamensis]|uniref:NUDIX hydrolase n=1 Tax=Streptomyces tateyamensis TaxID=565073 RepID=A0A2V4PNX4_9ACTN|nr:NUDIX hydrolase [Streptomyces tateyamensis]PYC87993.1 NUDIX hydrolase [Streptomyces tateyamensis]
MAHSDIDVTAPPARRIGAVVLITQGDTVGLVKPTYKDGWQLPGGGAHQNETPGAAGARELEEETGLVRNLTHFLALDWIEPNEDTGAAEGYNVVLDGGHLVASEAEGITIPEAARGELSAFEWVPVAHLDRYTKPYQANRIREALDARASGLRMPLLVHGQRVVA